MWVVPRPTVDGRTTFQRHQPRVVIAPVIFTRTGFGQQCPFVRTTRARLSPGRRGVRRTAGATEPRPKGVHACRSAVRGCCGTGSVRGAVSACVAALTGTNTLISTTDVLPTGKGRTCAMYGGAPVHPRTGHVRPSRADVHTARRRFDEVTPADTGRQRCQRSRFGPRGRRNVTHEGRTIRHSSVISLRCLRIKGINPLLIHASKGAPRGTV
jgi:hypothetical protein